MRRSVCYCEPASALAGEINTWQFVYQPAASLPKGTRLRFDMQAKGRLIDWEIPSADLNKTQNVIYLKLDKNKPIAAQEIELPNTYVPVFDFILPKPLKAGESATIVIGSPKAIPSSFQKLGNSAQTKIQRRRPFHLHVDPSGKGKFGDPEIFMMDIRGNSLSAIQIITPSFVVKNKRFDVIARFEDQFGNLTSHTDPNTLIELSYEHLRENLNWKLFIPETGFISLPNLYFNEPGVYTIRLKNLRTKETFSSSPIRCFPELQEELYWGILHGESERFDSTEDIENCLRHFRDDRALHFFATSPFDDSDEMPNETWKLISQNMAEFSEENRFVTIPGFQWNGKAEEEGLRQLLFAKETKNLFRKKEIKATSLKKMYKMVAPKEMIAIPCFTMGTGFSFDFKNFDPEVERVVEIYNAWGSSECLKKEGNLFPIHGTKKPGVKENAEGAIRKALQQNCRFGFIAGGLDDRGIYSDFFEGDQVQYSPGMTAILASTQSREALFEALYNRACYATTGPRIILGLHLAGSRMGMELDTAKKPGLLYNRHLSVYAAGTDDLKNIEIIRNGKVLHVVEPTGYACDFTYDDMEALEKVVIKPKDKAPPFVFYYIRVTQKDGHMAWSSPIWVDLVPSVPKAKLPRKATESKEDSLETLLSTEEE